MPFRRLPDTDAGRTKALTTAKEKADTTDPAQWAIDAATKARVSVGGISNEAALLLTERGVKPLEDGVAWRRDRRLTLPSPFRLTEKQIRAFIAAIECPTLVVLGSHHSPWWNEEAMQSRADSARDLTVVELEGYHHLHMETPEPVAEAINHFFATD